MTDTALLTPLVYDLAQPAGTRRFRKQLLPIGSLNYSDVHGPRRLDFTRDYLAGLSQAFKNRARGAVSFFLAGPRNEHNEDGDRLRGELVDVDLSHDGLYGVIEMSDAGAKLVADHPDLGVSCRIREHDNNGFPAVIEHVLGTFDPRIAGMTGWQPIDLSNPTGTVIDLSNEQWSTTSEYAQALIDLAYSDEDADTRAAALDLHRALLEQEAAASSWTVDLALAEARADNEQAQQRLARVQQIEADRLAAAALRAADEAGQRERNIHAFRDNYGEAWLRDRRPVMETDLAQPVALTPDEKRAADIREHRRRSGI